MRCILLIVRVTWCVFVIVLLLWCIIWWYLGESLSVHSEYTTITCKCDASRDSYDLVTSLLLLNFNVLVIYFFNVHGSVHREPMSIIVQQDATRYSLLYFCKLLYMFRVVTQPIIRNTYNSNYIIWHWANFGKCSVWCQLKMGAMDRTRLCYLPRSRKVAETGLYFSSLADFTHCIFRSSTSARCCNYSYTCSWWWV